MTTPVSGLVVVDKPAGMTSHSVVGRIRRLAGTRKVGHAGTLDPMATGVLLVGVDRATRLLGHLMLTEKAYDATVRLGMTTTTDDADGEPTGSRGAGELAGTAVREAFGTQTGQIDQVPSAVSAIKVDGKRAYQRVREGEQVELKARTVTVHDLTVGDPRPVRLEDGTTVLDVDISVRCSSGTYIRAIARDVGEALGVGGHLTALRRTAVGPYDLTFAQSLEELAEGEWVDHVLPMARTARAAFPAVDLGEEQAREVRYGRKLTLALDSLSAVFDPSGEFLALYEPTGAQDRARPVAVFVG
ncbi:tRNA pseudouridine(55) synthase TruB [Nocardioides insulae]|uniref:tRNA pseudouridine(55) synthase TruB n=1 Tax=Nocardioides insulae TaxID=394734 RepID=UPI0003F50C47|nr:tRNA pseudouridine(55) synthase TruB [Nocardioides insulae]